MTLQILAPLQGSHPVTTSFGVPDALTGAIHQAIDWSVPKGTPVYAVADGIITRSDSTDPVGGNRIELRTKAGDVAGYAHLAQRFAFEGQAVHAGQLIGTSGDSGKVTGAHLHFSFQHNGKYVDPRSYIAHLADPSMYDKWVAMYDKVSKSVGTILVAPNVSCPAGTTPGFGPFVGNPLPGWNVCSGKPTDPKYTTGFDNVKGTLEETPGVAQALAVGDFLTKVVNPANWAKILAIIGGAGLIVWGGKMLYEAT